MLFVSVWIKTGAGSKRFILSSTSIPLRPINEGPVLQLKFRARYSKVSLSIPIGW
jgi:hypothetical protein